MRYIITGGTGLIGSALAEALVKDNHEVYLLSRNPGKFQTGAPSGARLLAWDGRTSTGWGSLVNHETGIINLAGANLGQGRWTSKRKKEIIESRTNAGQAIVQAVDQAAEKPRVVLQSSAVGYYGSRADEIITEKTPSGKDFASMVTVKWEESTLDVEASGVRRAIFRTGVVLSLKAGAFPRLLLPFRFLVGGPIGNGKQWFPWIHLEDEITGICFLLDNPDAKGVYNLSAPEPVQSRDLSKAIGKIMHRPAKIPAPAFALRMLFGEMSTILLASQRMTPTKLIQEGMQFRFPKIESALNNLLR